MGVAAPVIEQEMADWVKLGGGNSGIVGDPNHSYGFHVAADELPASDYSRTHDPQGSDGPYVNWDYACAGDFSHRNDERLRAMHRNVLARLLRGELPMICEFIGQPWADQPVYYWARWTGKLQRYTGSGHDHWSHISWYRSMVDQRAYLWKEAGNMFGLECKYGQNGGNVPFWQWVLGPFGLGFEVDTLPNGQPTGIYGNKTKAAVKASGATVWTGNDGSVITSWEAAYLLIELGKKGPASGPPVLVPHTHDGGSTGPAKPTGK